MSVAAQRKGFCFQSSGKMSEKMSAPTGRANAFEARLPEKSPSSSASTAPLMPQVGQEMPVTNLKRQVMPKSRRNSRKPRAAAQRAQALRQMRAQRARLSSVRSVLMRAAA